MWLDLLIGLVGVGSGNPGLARPARGNPQGALKWRHSGTWLAWEER
jgi:hypothetical protein